MPTNEQIIEAARRRMAQGDVLRIETELTSGYSPYKYTVVFSDRGHWTVMPEEAESVNFAAPERKPWACTQTDARRIGERLFGRIGPEDILNLMNVINSELERQPAPERKPICETQVRAAIQEAMLNYLPGDVRNVTKALNEVLDLQPAPVEAEREVWKPTDKQSERILGLLDRAPEGVDRIALLIDAIQQMQGKFHRERGMV